MNEMIITIDGAAGTGKSTVAKKVADSLAIAYFDTGAMYRAFAYHVLHSKVEPSDVKAVISAINTFNFSFQGQGSQKTYFVNNVDITHELRTPAVTDASSIISQYSEVRNALHKVQKDFATEHDAVFEGRDLGTVIFPSAEFKFFLKASDEVRASRRFEEMKHKGMNTTFNEVLESIRQRDQRDEGRKVAPLKCASDASVIDTSLLSIDDVVGLILKKIKESV
jgi:CMP/dCMP kinase